MMGSRRPVVTVKAIRNALTVFAIVYVVIRGLASSPSSSNSFVLGAFNPPLLSPQDQAFVVQCRTFYEQSALRRSHCDDPPASLCQNVCSSLASNLTYYSTQLWPSSLLAACDATCATHQSQLCNGGITYMELCDATARSRLQAAVVDNVHVTIQDDRSGPSFFALLVLIFVAASDILVSVAEYKDKYLKAPPADEEAALYDASQLDSSAALLTQALRAAEQPEHLVTVAKTCFEVRCLLFDNSCDQALQIIVVFQLETRVLQRRRVILHVDGPAEIGLEEIVQYNEVDTLRSVNPLALFLPKKCSTTDEVPLMPCFAKAHRSRLFDRLNRRGVMIDLSYVIVTAIGVNIFGRVYGAGLQSKRFIVLDVYDPALALNHTMQLSMDELENLFQDHMDLLVAGRKEDVR
ncbi:hypothetical protein DYB37_004856 [Aphanomyces astaci]|uniref:Uncharacterized protein n=1 Tax=Aphanomyces astaci TaxID=112090 RepID=A0A397DPZ5_APHAT|nr:hypothetical protein DYB30_004435 [Aphanomyces astaci]RHY87183.1 hypothetical protein DYB35_005413 [Aphanomyces astaci]RHZ20805.1 hypothetical protein DYB37_004856 [Aphanomyces astaci]